MFLLQLSRVRRRGWEMLHMGLEDHQVVQEMEGTRRCLHHLPLASARAKQAAHSRMGRRYQILGLNK